MHLPPTKRKFSILIAILFILPLSSFNQVQTIAREGPKIGLVLSGGGAKGLAHIGILKSLEEAGITPDIITGTSMGSIIGGLYSIGYTADEIKEFALSADWDLLLSNKTMLNEVVYEEKDYYGRYLYEIGIKGIRPELPKGLIEGQKLSNLLSDLTRPVQDISDFSRFPIPFACVAADIETGMKVVLNHGSLARSLRASMAIPSIFTPVEIDGKYLVDGGLVRNFPVEENVDLGADYIIGVFVGNQLLKRDEMDSPLSVLTQSAFIHSSFDTRVERALVDLYIEPDMESYGPGSFAEAAAIIEIGEKVGLEFLEEFRYLKDSMETAGWTNHPVTKPAISDSTYVSEITVNGNHEVSDRFILNRLGIEGDSWITIDALQDGLDNLFGTLYFTRIQYEFRSKEEGKELVIEVAEAPEGQIKGALQYDLETEISLLLNVTYRNLLLANSRIILEGEISNSPTFDLNYLKYFGYRQNQSFVTGYYHRNIGIPLIENGMKSALYEMDLNRFYAGLQSSSRTNRILQLLYSHERAVLEPEVVSNADYTFNKLTYKAHQILLNFEFNNLNNRYYPTEGVHHRISFKYMGIIDLDMEVEPSDPQDPGLLQKRAPASISPSAMSQWVIPLGDRMSLNLKAGLDFTVHVRESIDSLELNSGILDMNYIGGYRKIMPNFNPFWGAELQEYHSEHLFSGELIFQYKVGRQIYIQALGQFYHAYLPFGWIIPAMKESIYYMGGRDYLLGFGCSVAYMSPIGPISYSIGQDIHGHGTTHFLNLGFYFDPD
ncbi:MAG: patatin-like phospholipase family protein [Bacteroidales bacterium]